MTTAAGALLPVPPSCARLTNRKGHGKGDMAPVSDWVKITRYELQ